MYGWGWSFLGMNLLWWFFWVLLIIGFFSMATPVRRSHAPRPPDPLQILQRRYAAGELTTAEYEERRATLLRDRQVPPPERPAPPATPTTSTPVHQS